ncbi:MAG: hypothetical protein U0790_25225 [Isosphaeraceae bacterium]|jgi:hypothetical protein
MSTQIDSESVLQTIQTASEGPAEVSSDAGSAKQFSLTELIAAHRYLAATQAAAATIRRSGLRFARLIPPGTVQRDTTCP